MRNLNKLSAGDLLKLRADVDAALAAKREEIEGALAALNGTNGRRSLKGRKVTPKYRDPASGQTWAGRGARPRWLVAALKKGRKLESFLIR